MSNAKMEVDSMLKGTEFLEHYGTKGMRWGVRRAEKRAAKADQKWQKNIYSLKGAIAVHNASADRFNAQIDAVNAKHPKAHMFDRPNSKETKAYLRDIETLTNKSVEEAVASVHGVSPSGKLRAKVDFSDPEQPKIVMSPNDVEHADETFSKLIFKVSLTEDGLIDQLYKVQDSLAQSDDLGTEEFLEHYGIKGMQWGVRRSKSSGGGGKTTYQKKPARLTDAELNQRIKRLELERKYSELNSAQRAPGKKYAKGILEQQGRNAVGAVVGTTVAFIVQKQLKKYFG